MPQKHQPMSLSKWTINVLAQNWDRLCYSCSSSRDMNALIESDEYLLTQGPLTNMPSSILEEMLEVIAERRSLSRKFLHMLIQRQLRCLNLSFGTGEVHYGFLFLERCHKLQVLNLSFLRHIEPHILMKLIPHLSFIVSLNLKMTSTVDQILEEIGRNCGEIQELNLTSTPITDRGLKSLCFGEEKRTRRSQKLKALILEDTRTTWVGASYLLQHLPQLTHLEFDKMFQVFEHLDPKCLTEISPDATLKLRSIYSTVSSITPASIDSAALMCPKTEIISLMNAWIDNETLYRFMQFENLRSLVIVNNEKRSVEYGEGVLPLLTVCGETLENLILNNFDTVDIISLGRSCPHLKKLALCGVKEFAYPNSSPRPITGLFCSLLAIELWFDDRTERISSPILLQLLHEAKDVTNLLVKSSDFSLDLFTKIWATNEMRRLSRVTTDQCRNVTLDFFTQLLDMENDLSLIRMWGCGKISKWNYEALKERIKGTNLNVYIEWFP